MTPINLNHSAVPDPIQGWTPLISVDVAKNVLRKSNNSQGSVYANAQRERNLRVKGQYLMLDLLNRRLAKPNGDRRIDLLCRIHLPKPAARFDPPNLYPTVKPLIDGFTDAGYWTDDDYHVIRRTIFEHDTTPTGQTGLWRFDFHTRPVEENQS